MLEKSDHLQMQKMIVGIMWVNEYKSEKEKWKTTAIMEDQPTIIN